MASIVAVPRRLGADLLCLVLVVALASGCTTVRPVMPTSTGSYASIKPGDKVRIVTRDGRDLTLTVTAVAADSLVGNPQPKGVPPVTVAFSDIVTMEKVQFSPALGIPVAAGCVGVVFLTAALLVVTALVAILTIPAQGPVRPATDHAAP